MEQIQDSLKTDPVYFIDA